MARLRLFGPAREAAGTASAEVGGSTVEEVVAEAARRFGGQFAEVAARSKTWVNGTEAGPEAPVAATDEVAVLPPVSGGA
ncbi:MAG TPA: MoaD/ThiS family protein [Acidimicrobiales bacterium]|nr:MoaD/ThiS family protein [Acidimicrobiales bacterium]